MCNNTMQNREQKQILRIHGLAYTRSNRRKIGHAWKFCLTLTLESIWYSASGPRPLINDILIMQDNSFVIAFVVTIIYYLAYLEIINAVYRNTKASCVVKSLFIKKVFIVTMFENHYKSLVRRGELQITMFEFSHQKIIS